MRLATEAAFLEDACEVVGHEKQCTTQLVPGWVTSWAIGKTLHKHIMLFYNNRTSHITDSWEKLETTANECLLSFCIQTFPPPCPRNADEENEIMCIVKLEPAHKLLFMHTNLEPEFDFAVLKKKQILEHSDVFIKTRWLQIIWQCNAAWWYTAVLSNRSASTLCQNHLTTKSMITQQSSPCLINIVKGLEFEVFQPIRVTKIKSNSSRLKSPIK